MNVEDPHPSGGPELNWGHESPDQQLLDESWTFCPCVMRAHAAYCRPTNTPECNKQSPGSEPDAL
jgi:hypothetical protein